MPSTVTDRIDGVTTSAAVKTPVKILTTAPITLSGAQTLQGVVLTAYSGPGLPADRVCVAGQADLTTNGIYLVQTGAWTREPDFDGARDAVTGTLVSVLQGTYAGSLWELTTTDNPVIIGTSNLTFAQAPIGNFAATSTTSNTIATGAKTFTTQPGLSIATTSGQFLLIASSASPSNYFHGQITSYSTTTGVLVMNILDVGGSGTFAAWTISLSSPVGPAAGNNTITNAMLAQAPANTVKLNNTNATANETDLSMAASTFLARLASGNIVSATVAQALTLLGIASVGNTMTGNLPTAMSGNHTTAAITVSSGYCSDSTNASLLIGAGYSWLASNGNAINGTDAASSTLANSTTYHMYLCSGATGTGTFCSASLTPTLPTGYNTYKRRIFSFNTTAAGVPIPYTPIEAEGGATINWLTTQVLDVNVSNLSTTRVAYALTVPGGIKVQPLYRVNTATANDIILTSGDETDIAPTNTNGGFTTVPGMDLAYNVAQTLSITVGRDGILTTNTSSQIGARSTASSTTLYLVTRGFKDFRRT